MTARLIIPLGNAHDIRMKTTLFSTARFLASLVCAITLINPVRGAEGPFAVSFDGVDDYVFTPDYLFYNNRDLTVTA
jgi:hypothetical protein